MPGWDSCNDMSKTRREEAGGGSRAELRRTGRARAGAVQRAEWRPAKFMSITTLRKGLYLERASSQMQLVKMIHTGSVRALNATAGVLVREMRRRFRHTDAQGRRPCEDEGRNQRVKAIKAEEHQKFLAATQQERSNGELSTTDTLVLDFRPPEL